MLLLVVTIPSFAKKIFLVTRLRFSTWLSCTLPTEKCSFKFSPKSHMVSLFRKALSGRLQIDLSFLVVVAVPIYQLSWRAS